jgi:predicted DNA-binding transcriptional regulator AlpA
MAFVRPPRTNMTRPNAHPRPVLTTAELAEYLDVSVTTIKNWRMSGKGPRALKLADSHTVRYRLIDVDRWLDTQDFPAPARRRRRRTG